MRVALKRRLFFYLKVVPMERSRGQGLIPQYPRGDFVYVRSRHGMEVQVPKTVRLRVGEFHAEDAVVPLEVVACYVEFSS